MIITKKKVTSTAQFLYDRMRRTRLSNNKYKIPFCVGYRKALDDMCRALGAELYDVAVVEEGEDEH